MTEEDNVVEIFRDGFENDLQLDIHPRDSLDCGGYSFEEVRLTVDLRFGYSSSLCPELTLGLFIWHPSKLYSVVFSPEGLTSIKPLVILSKHLLPLT